MSDLLVVNIGTLATAEGRSARGGPAQGEVRALRDAWVRIEAGVITAVGTGEPPQAPGAARLDAGGRLVTPGLVDAHTHLIFGGWRQHELGAHAVPEEYRDNRAGYVRLVCEEMIPAAAGEGLAKFCDVFCETGVFSAGETRTILEAGLRHGLRPKIHADEIDAIGGSQLAREVGAVSCEHLIACPPEGIAAMAAAGTVACLLPATSFYLGAAYAPARAMVDAGVPVALATDFNPGSCPCLNMQLVMSLGCLKYRLTPEEVLTAVTLNGAAAADLADAAGSLEPGKLGDLVIWEAEDLDYLCYRLGSNLARTVVKRGAVFTNHTEGVMGPEGERNG